MRIVFDILEKKYVNRMVNYTHSSQNEGKNNRKENRNKQQQSEKKKIK